MEKRLITKAESEEKGYYELEHGSLVWFVSKDLGDCPITMLHGYVKGAKVGQKGAGPQWHDFDEIIHMVKGEMTEFIDGEPYPLKPGDTVLIVDVSASMRAQEGNASRFEEAKREAKRRIDALAGDSRMLLMARGRHPRLLSSFESNKQALHDALGVARIRQEGSDLFRGHRRLETQLHPPAAREVEPAVDAQEDHRADRDDHEDNRHRRRDLALAHEVEGGHQIQTLSTRGRP